MKTAVRGDDRGAVEALAAWLWRLPLLFMVVTALQVLVLRFIDPPFTAFMAARQFDALGEGDFGFRIAYDWRDLDEISRNVPLAMIAAEDQNFANHHGFDFKAIERARAHNERAEERARKRNKPVKRIRGASTISQQTAKNLFLWRGQGITRWVRKGAGGLVHGADRDLVAEEPHHRGLRQHRRVR